MANQTITDLTAGSALTGSEELEMVQGGNSRKTTSAQIVNLAKDAVVNSVTGLTTDNTDPLNPIVGITVGSGLSGDGTVGSPLVTTGLTNVSTGLSGNGTSGSPLTVSQPTLTATLTLTAAQILASNTTPIQMIAAPGANKIIQVLGMVMAVFTYNSVAYATNTQMGLGYNVGGTFLTLLQSPAIDLSLTANNVQFIPFHTNSIGGTLSVANTPIVVSALSGNPTAGNSTMKIYLNYVIINA